MDIVPWKPFGELTSLKKEMDSMWNRLLREAPFSALASQEWNPLVDVSESKNSLLIKAELPGMDAKDVSVSVSGDILTIKGEKKREKEKKMSIITAAKATPAPFNAQ